jgi:hypothetical protein
LKSLMSQDDWEKLQSIKSSASYFVWSGVVFAREMKVDVLHVYSSLCEAEFAEGSIRLLMSVCAKAVFEAAHSTCSCTQLQWEWDPQVDMSIFHDVKENSTGNSRRKHSKHASWKFTEKSFVTLYFFIDVHISCTNANSAMNLS